MARKKDNELIKVVALDTYKKLNIKDADLQIVPEEGYEFEITAERFTVLNGKNKFKQKFVKKVK